MPLPGGARDVGGDDVGGMPVQAAAGPLIPHRGARISMRSGFLYVAQRDPGVQTGREHVPTLSNAPAGAGKLELFLIVGDHGYGSAQPCRGLSRSRPGGCEPAAAVHAWARPRLGARQRAAWLAGEPGRRDSASWAR